MEITVNDDNVLRFSGTINLENLNAWLALTGQQLGQPLIKGKLKLDFSEMIADDSAICCLVVDCFRQLSRDKRKVSCESIEIPATTKAIFVTYGLSNILPISD